MTSSGGPGPSGPSLERVVGEAFVKAGEVILESRIYRPRNKAVQEQGKGRAWFNLEVEEVEGASKALERWRRETGLPLVIEVLLQPWGSTYAGQQDRVETLLERWVVHYFPMLPEGPSHLSRSQLSRLNPSSVYKRLVITMRSLYTYVRVLPAYRMYRACKRQGGANFTLGYRLHSTLPGASAASAPGARRMQSFRFGAVDTPYGQLRISVDYQPASTVTILEQTTSPPALPQIIADYVGSPTAAASRGAGAPVLRHAMSASGAGAGWGAIAGGLPPSPRLEQQQVGVALPSPRQPGSSPREGSSHPGLGPLPMRRSWSTSLRGASPHRTLSHPSSELPSPRSARDPPYGSAPQQPASLPAMLRALSSPGAKYAAGSPSGRPPLAKPPRGCTAPLAADPGSHRHASPAPVPSSSPPGGSLGGVTGVEEGDEEGDIGGDSPCGSTGSSARKSSEPVCIPGRGDGLGGGRGRGAGRRLRSSGDLWAMQHSSGMHQPLSAPAVSHIQQVQSGNGAEPAVQAAAAMAGQSASNRGKHRRRGGDAPPVAQPSAHAGMQLAALESESSGSNASSVYPTSCSPQLPFAFTPSAQSLASYGVRGPLQDSTPGRLDRVSPRLGRTLSSTSASGGSASHMAGAVQLQQQQQQQQQRATAGGTAGLSPGSGSGGSTGAVVGREVAASTALMRRPSWSSRSSAFAQLAGDASQAGVGYSVSPMQDPALESMLAGSTPRQFALASGGLPSPVSAVGSLGVALDGGGGRPISRATSSTSGFGAPPPLLTCPALSPEVSGALSALDEADVLPFALDEASSPAPFKPCSPAPECPAQHDHVAEQLPVSSGAGCNSSLHGGGSTQAAILSPASAAELARSGHHATGAHPLPAVGPVMDTDAAVGAFVRLIQDAPPLRMAQQPRGAGRAKSADLSSAALAAAAPGTSSGSDSSGATCLSDGRALTLQAGLRHFSRIKERLQQRGILVGPAPGQA